MLTLYVKSGCPYCAKVLLTLAELDLPFEEKNIADPAVSDELMARGGERLVPYLVDTEHNVEMYESDAIVKHLHEAFSPNP